MIISIGGKQGAGKSTVAKMLAAKLGWPCYFMGDLRRKKAAELGLTLAEYNKLGKNDPQTDFLVDEYQKELGEKEDNFIIEGRTSWYFIPKSLKIFLDINETEGTRRILNDLKHNSRKRNEDININNFAELSASNMKRVQSDNIRYYKYYGIDVFDKKQFDFVLNTTDYNINEVFEILYEYIRPLIDKK
jgi:CMP/dCMP kinase